MFLFYHSIYTVSVKAWDAYDLQGKFYIIINYIYELFFLLLSL